MIDVLKIMLVQVPEEGREDKRRRKKRKEETHQEAAKELHSGGSGAARTQSPVMEGC